MEYLISLSLALALTLAVEVPVCMLMGLRKKELLIVLLANVMTNPAVNVLYLLGRTYTPLPVVAVIAILEISAVVVEWIVYRLLTDARRPFLVSLVANAVSYGTGLIITTIIR